MQAASMLPVSGPAGTDDLAAGGGLELPGHESHAAPLTADSSDAHRREPIPGARETDTLTHREPGAIGGQFTGEDVPAPRRQDWLAEDTAVDRALEGGGGSVKRAKRRIDQEREP